MALRSLVPMFKMLRRALVYVFAGLGWGFAVYLALKPGGEALRQALR